MLLTYLSTICRRQDPLWSQNNPATHLAETMSTAGHYINNIREIRRRPGYSASNLLNFNIPFLLVLERCCCK